MSFCKIILILCELKNKLFPISSPTGGFLLSLGIINSRVTGFSIKDLVEFIIVPGACTALIMKVKLGNFT